MIKPVFIHFQMDYKHLGGKYVTLQRDPCNKITSAKVVACNTRKRRNKGLSFLMRSSMPLKEAKSYEDSAFIWPNAEEHIIFELLLRKGKFTNTDLINNKIRLMNRILCWDYSGWIDTKLYHLVTIIIMIDCFQCIQRH